MDSRNQYCPEAINSKIQWRTFLATVLKACCHLSNLVDINVVWSQWSKEFKKHFPKIISEKAEKHEVELSAVEFEYRCPRGNASIRLADYMTGISREQESSNIRITTIHQVKGETHDATLLVSSPDKRGSKGGYWSEWFDKSVDGGEHTRFAYVASSRPRRLLAWAIPENNKEGITKLQELGFVVIKNLETGK